MTGIHINDTYGPIHGVDQFCECTNCDDLRIGDVVVLEIDSGLVPFEVALLEAYPNEGGYGSGITGVGLVGSSSELVMPGDRLQSTSGGSAAEVANSHFQVAVDENQHIEVRRQLVAV